MDRDFAGLMYHLALAATGPVLEPEVAHVYATGALRGREDRITDPRGQMDTRALDAFGAALARYATEPGDITESFTLDRIIDLLVAVSVHQLVRWLQGFERSSLDFVRRHLLHRTGAVRATEGGAIEIEWMSSGFDGVLDRVGYLEPVHGVPWWNGRGLRWTR
jgi:hypothetical protein